MFFILSKVLDFLLSPLIWIILILLYAFFSRNAGIKKKFFLAGLLLLLFFSNNFIVNEALLAWEGKPMSISELKNYDTAIVLIGITSNHKGINDRVFFNKGADRLLHAVQLYNAGKIKKILVSGGSGAIMGEQISEAGQLKKVFIYCGVPEAAIIIEDKSNNTVENARFSKRIIDSLYPSGEEFLLITSAFHIPRAEGCFKKAGIRVDTYPVDFYSNERAGSLIPSGYALHKWSILIHELSGYIIYKIMGYS